MDTRSENTAQRACRHCGMQISGALYAREQDGYCCEGCFLSARAQRAVATAGAEAQLALVEAPAAALDAACAEMMRYAGTQFDPDALDMFLAEKTTLRNMVDLKCGTAVRDPVRTGSRTELFQSRNQKPIDNGVET